MDGGLVDTVTTGDNGRVHVDLDAGDYYAVEIEAAHGFKLDDTPHYFTVTDGKTTTLTVKNKPFSGILIHKTDSYTSRQDRHKRNVIAVASLEDAPPGFAAEQAESIKGLHVYCLEDAGKPLPSPQRAAGEAPKRKEAER